VLKFLKNVLEVFGVVYLRFRIVPRLWCVWLVAVNAVSLIFIDHIEAQAVLAATGIAVVIQALVYEKTGFTRILGSAHILWVPMFVWMWMRLETIQADPALATWLAVLFATNTVSLLIDVIDAVRYLRGEQAPHYRWHRTQLV
jgi:hypothetical protein